MKVMPIVADHYCDYFVAFCVVRFVEISGILAKNKIWLEKFV